MGDVIVGVDDRDVRDPASLMAAVSAHKGGDAVNLKVRRGTAYSTFAVTLANR
jgi:S1-C subfamily serine protease